MLELPDDPDRPEAADWADSVLSRTASHGFAVLPVSRYGLDVQSSQQVAERLVEKLGAAAVRAGAPAGLRVEPDRPQATQVERGHRTRTLLPHHDGQHESYLTPSRQDAPQFPTRARVTSASGYTTTRSHKLYQSVFVREPGLGRSVTTYYDWLAILRDSYDHQGVGDPADVAGVGRWLGDNVVRAVNYCSRERLRYLAIPAFLGDPRLHLLRVSFDYAERPIDLPAGVSGVEEILELAAACPCGRCEQDVNRVLCHVARRALGLSWTAFRERYERHAVTSRYDVVFGENLTSLHGGLDGDASRVIVPTCLVLDSASGAAYERWLAGAWRQRGFRHD